MSAKTMWNAMLIELAKWMLEQETAPGIDEDIVQGLQGWYKSMVPAP